MLNFSMLTLNFLTLTSTSSTQKQTHCKLLKKIYIDIKKKFIKQSKHLKIINTDLQWAV